MAALAVAALAISCQKNETVVENPAFDQQAIAFSTYTGNAPQGKGTIMDNDVLKKEFFGVTAFYTGQTAWSTPSIAPNFMYNQEVKCVNNAWEYTPVKYWPTMVADKISFFAYAPYATNGSEHGIALSPAEVATNSLSFTVADKASDMVDFVAAVVIDETHDGLNNSRGNVVFSFKHELSRLAFKVALDEDLAEKSTVVVKEAVLATGDTYYKAATYTFANENGKRGTWSYEPSNKMALDYDITSSAAFTKVELGAKETKYTQEKALALTKDDAVNFLGENQYLFLIPVSANDGDGAAEKSTAVTFVYDIVTEDAALPAGYSCTEATKTVYMPKGFLKQGVAYNVLFTFHVDDITVEASVEGWGDEVDLGNVDVPFTPDDATVPSTPAEGEDNA